MRTMTIMICVILITGCTPEKRIENAGTKGEFTQIPIEGGYLLTDNVTGCQYIAGGTGSSFIPRYDAKGNILCKEMSK